ncbi:hypothetical protein KKA33_04245 [Patescibacteria group bacterium]|nr:hypothetical protein [Patescibacteria group bacterium]
MPKQFELNFEKNANVPIRYDFPQAYLKGIVRKEIAKIAGNPDLLPDDLNIPDVRKEIQEVLEERGLKADFREDGVVIRPGEKDNTGEYYEEYEEGRQVG